MNAGRAKNVATAHTLVLQWIRPPNKRCYDHLLLGELMKKMYKTNF